MSGQHRASKVQRKLKDSVFGLIWNGNRREIDVSTPQAVDHFLMTLRRLIADTAPALLAQFERQVIHIRSNSEDIRGYARYVLEAQEDAAPTDGPSLGQESARRAIVEAFAGLNLVSARVIDFGSGASDAVRVLLALGASAIGVESNPLRVASAMAAGLDVRFAFIDSATAEFCADSRIQAGSADAVCSTLVLDRVSRPNRLLENMVWSLRPGGRFSIQTLLPIVPIDDGPVEIPIVYTRPEQRLGSGRSSVEDCSAILEALHRLQVRDVTVSQYATSYASLDGIQHYSAWTFRGTRT